MAWTTPATVVADTTELTADLWNEQVRDNTSFLYTPPSCNVYNDANISVNNDTATTLTWNSENWDTDSMHSTSSNTSRITCNTAGVYLFYYNLRWTSDVNNVNGIWLVKNGNTSIRYGEASFASTLSATGGLNAQLKLAVNDYVEVIVYHFHGSARSTLATYMQFGATWIGNG